MLSRQNRRTGPHIKSHARARIWASVGMSLTFRAEVMPGRESDRRTFTVTRVLKNGRVELSGLSGQHAEAEFETLR